MRAVDPDRVAAVLIEPILGEAGVVVPSSDYLGALRQLCTERNVLLMVDEIQTGLGRTGRWFAFQHLGIEPDVVTMAKALGNGMPVGACWARAEVAAAFVPGDHGSTFGGQPLAMAAARATLAVMEAEDVPGPGGRRRCPPTRWARATAGCRPCPGRGPAAGRRPGQRFRRARPAPRLSRAVWSSMRRGRTCCGSRRRCWCPMPTSTGRWRRCRRSWPGCRLPSASRDDTGGDDGGRQP